MRIERHQGNSKRIRRQVVDSAGAAVNVTGNTFVLTVNSDNNPTDLLTQMFQVTATLENALTGLIYFLITGPNAATAVGNYYYDIQWTDANGETETLEKGEYVICARINQS